MIALIDYGAGNLTSVRKALAAIGAEVYTPSTPEDLARAAGVIVPGVGHFGATAALDERWRAALLASVRARRPLLGICLGMQWLFEGSDEAPELPGLGLLKGRCQQLGLAWQPPSDVEIQDRSKWKVPHIGWNTLLPAQPSRLLSGRPPMNDAYFAHSYAAPISTECVATTTHGVMFSSMVERDDVYGVQFHPEKSSDAGLAVLRNFVGRTRGEEVSPLVVTGRSSAGMLTARRVIACLDVRNGGVVKGTRFVDLRDAGDPASLARRYNAEGIDELVILDITATLEDRRALAETVRAVARELFIPLTVGGGIRSEADAAAAIEAGADKVSVNTAALADPSLLTRLAAQYGSQAVVVAIDAKRERGGFSVYSRSGTAATSRDAIGWAREATDAGAGEILLTSMDRDGTRAGFDCEMTAAISRAVPIPVIASGGAGEPEHFVEVFTAGHADAALAASIFHYRERGIGDLKRLLASRGIPVRQVDSDP